MLKYTHFIRHQLSTKIKKLELIFRFGRICEITYREKPNWSCKLKWTHFLDLEMRNIECNVIPDAIFAVTLTQCERSLEAKIENSSSSEVMVNMKESKKTIIAHKDSHSYTWMNKIANAPIQFTRTAYFFWKFMTKVEILFASSVYLRQHFQWTNAMFFSKKLTTYIDSFIQWRSRAHRGAVSHQRRIMRLCHSTPVLISTLTFTDPNHSALKPNTPKVWSSLHVNCQFLFLFFFDRGKYTF